MTTRAKFRNRREKRQSEAVERQTRYDKLSTSDKIARLIPGGSFRQRERLA